MADQVDVGRLLDDVERKRNVKKVLATPVQRPTGPQRQGEIVIRINRLMMERAGYWMVIIILAALVFVNPFKDGSNLISGDVVSEPPATTDTASNPTTTTNPPPPPPAQPTSTSTNSPPVETTPDTTIPSTATGVTSSTVDLEILDLVSEAKSYGAKLSGVKIRIKNNGDPFTPVLVVNTWSNSFTTYKETPRKVFKQLQKFDYYEFEEELVSGATVPSFTIQFEFVPVQTGEDGNVKVSLYRDSFDANNPTQNLIKSVTKKEKY